MSVSFQIMKGRKGWRFEAEGKYDLTNWDIQYRPDRIICTPQPLEFIYMAFGAILFIGLAIAFLLFAINPRLFVGHSSTAPRWITPIAAVQLQDKSKYQQELPSQDEIDRATRNVMDNLLKDKSPEERDAILKRMRESQKQRDSDRAQQQRKFDQRLGVLMKIGRVLAAIPILLFAFIGGWLCLPRAILFFWNRVTISCQQGYLNIIRPKLLGGDDAVKIPLAQLGPVLTSGQRRYAGRNAGHYVAWMVQITSRSPDISPVQFEVEHNYRSTETAVAPIRVQRLAKSLSQMTGKPLGRRKK